MMHAVMVIELYTSNLLCLVLTPSQTDSSNSLISDTSKTHQTDHTSHQLNSSIESKQKTKTDKEEISSLSKDQTSVDFVCIYY